MNIPVTPAPDKRAPIAAWAIIPLAIAAIAACLLRADGALHWDEPGYLYMGIYRSFAELIAGQVQITGIDDFTQGRILHVLQINALMGLIGSSAGTFWTLVVIHLFLLVGILMLTHRMLRELLPHTAQVTAGTLVAAMSPIVIYMAGKTLADTEALAMATLATWALLRCSRGVSISRVLGAAMAMAYITLTKNDMVFMPAGLCAAVALVPIAGIHRARVVGAGILSAVGAVAISMLALEALGIGIGRYLASYADALERAPPLAAKLMNISTELGVLWALVIAAWLSTRRREAAFLTLWLAFAMSPFVLLVVRRAEDCSRAKMLIMEAGGRAPLVAKIEKAEAIDHLDEIIATADAIMVARGDLGVETSVELVPVYQKRIIAKSVKAGKMVITATQMLQSMVSNPRPTRAEASDVANAVWDGTDALMLSNETASGQYPVPAVETMCRIIESAESGKEPAQDKIAHWVGRQTGRVSRALCEAAAFASDEMGTRVTAVLTESGLMARRLSALRPDQRIVALTNSEDVQNELALIWGVESLVVPSATTTDDILQAGEQALLESGVVEKGEMIVIMAGRLSGLGLSSSVTIFTVGGTLAPSRT